MISSNSDKCIQKIFEMISKVGTEEGNFPPTEIYNENWMLRIILDTQAKGLDCLPFKMHPNAMWFSEAQLPTAFRQETNKDDLGEKNTHADAVIGGFKFRDRTKTGFELTKDTKQFVVIEAKMYSTLSKRVTHAHYYDQASRTVACIASAIQESGKLVDDFSSLGFYIFAPEKQIDNGVFRKYIARENIRAQVTHRIEDYKEKRSKRYNDLQKWDKKFFTPTLKKIDLEHAQISWESIIQKIGEIDTSQAQSIEDFYCQCKKYNSKDIYRNQDS